jgi:uncharacterized membrane protein
LAPAIGASPNCSSPRPSANSFADKLPFTPSRLAGPPLTFRIASGGLAGWRVARADASPWVGLFAGAAGAIAGSYLGHAARRFAVRRLRLPDPLVAIAEDAIAVGAVLLLRRSRAE